MGVNWGSYNFNSIPFNTSLGAGSNITFSPLQIFLGRAGANVGGSFSLSDNIVLAPFLHASIWHDFANPNGATAQSTAGGTSVNFGVVADRVGTFGQIGAGVNFKIYSIDMVGFARGDLLLGSNITGGSFNIGLRKQF